eukprot:CAMPEP_0197553792 /NCGR_PEP_ID=MMETSP1320-20131121/9903_1 /TAXON_ID=91990 /ORGANISM="Bolidomonas sp., Strain RCC2347" /LENGTH=78 /DNA_ID=CAMNT_0043114601 /DNA_START=164 /DNA_END=400 /DNA_ORIENTATION=-
MERINDDSCTKQTWRTEFPPRPGDGWRESLRAHTIDIITYYSTSRTPHVTFQGEEDSRRASGKVEGVVVKVARGTASI